MDQYQFPSWVENSDCAVEGYPMGFSCLMKVSTNCMLCNWLACWWAQDWQMHWYLWFGYPHVPSFLLPSFLLLSSTPLSVAWVTEWLSHFGCSQNKLQWHMQWWWHHWELGLNRYWSGAYCGKYVSFVFGGRRNAGYQKCQSLFSTSTDGDSGIGCCQLPERVYSHGLMK